jgi:filamentous hemagglutinin family protein
MKQAQFDFSLHPLARDIARIFGATAMLAMPLAFAAPQGGNVSAGQAAIQHNGNLTTITQGSQRAAIDWRSFNVGSAETVNFIQPNASAAILNRVVGNDPSAIFGRITANGQVLLINPNGILFGRTAQVDVGALTATTTNLSNADFMAGRLNFNEPGKPGARVENHGRITVAEGGFAALVGRQVANSGVITARLGKVALAAGDAFVLDLYGDRLVNLIVDPAALSALIDAQGQPLAASVDHSGQIVAEGGRVQLSVATVKQLVDNLINLSGVVRATSFTSAPGVISLQGDANTRVAVSGTLDASGERGGSIEVTGRDVHLQSGASLAATGGQGSIAVGGDWQGKGPLAHADQVTVAEGATLDASGGALGSGGSVVLWSDKNTQFSGRISAAGGSARGDAGQVEVSSKGQLGFQGEVDVFAAHGQQGLLLLDPLNLTIAATSSGDSQIAADQLRYFLIRGANVNLSATQNVTVDAEVNGLVTGGTGVAGGGLTLTAGNDLTINQNIVLNNGALNLTAANGMLSQANNTVLYTGTGAATLRGGAGVDLGHVLGGGAVDIQSASGAVTVRNALVSATSNGAAAPVASLNVNAAGAVNLNGALVQGNATVQSVNAGVALAGAVVQSQAGNVQINAGTTITSAAHNVGLVAGGSVSATAGQAIDLGAVVSTDAATLISAGGGVTVRQAVTGAGGARTQGLTVNAAGPVALAGANVGVGGIAITSTGNVTSQGAGAAEGGLLSTGSVTVRSTAGRVGTAGAAIRVQAGSNVELAGSTGITADTVLGGGTVVLSSNAGSVAVTQAIAAEAGAVSRATATRPIGVMVSGRDGIELAGAVAGTNGLTLNSSAGAINLQNSVFSQGPVSVTAQGAITLANGAGIDTTRSDSSRNADGSVTLRSLGSTVTLGNAGVRTNGQTASVTVDGASGVVINGDIVADNDAIIISSGGAVTAEASSTSDAAADNATLDAGTHTTRSAIDITATGAVELGEMVAYNGIRVVSGGNVTLVRGLGGNTVDGTANTPYLTGYLNYVDGYQVQYRPTVGRLEVQSGGSVELNGLNLDGNASEMSTDFGLSVTAASRIVSNKEIAVNKGHIVLAGGNTQPTDGVYLGSSVYSRGYDVVSGNTRQKIGYGINISGQVLGLFDNTEEMARLPINTFLVTWNENGTTPREARVDAQGFLVDATGVRIQTNGSFQAVGYRVDASPGGNPSPDDMRIYTVDADARLAGGVQILTVQGLPQPAAANGNPAGYLQQEIAKIEIANNVANYQDNLSGTDNRGTLVPANVVLAGANRDVVINTQTIAGVANSTPRNPVHIASFVPQLTSLRNTPSHSTAPAAGSGAVAATSGIGLKLLGFEESGDASTVIWADTLQLTGGNLGAFFGYPGGVTADPAINGVFFVSYPGQASRSYSIGGVVTNERVLTGTAQGGLVRYRFEFISQASARLANVDLSGINTSTLPVLPTGATLISDWVVTGLRNEGETAGFRMVDPDVKVYGTANEVDVRASLYPAYAATPANSNLQINGTVTPDYRLLSPNFVQTSAGGSPGRLDPDGSFYTQGYRLQNVLVDSSTNNNTLPENAPGTRVFIYDGVINSANGSHIADYNSGTSIPPLAGVTGFNNSTVGFAGVGAGFGSLGNGTAGTTGVGSTTGQGVDGSQIPGGLSGGGTAPPVVAVDDRSTQDAGNAQPGAAHLPGDGELAFGVRVAAQADLGRSGAVPGSAVNVFKRRYRVATSSNPSVCAPGAVQQAPAEGATARDCAAK